MYTDILRNVNYQYSYPFQLKLKPATELHDKIVSELRRRALAGFSTVTNNHAKWHDIDLVMQTYMPQDQDESDIINKDIRKPTSIVYPYSLAIKETLLAHITKILLMEPIIRYQGIGPEDTIGALLLERIVGLHIDRNNVMLNLHTLIDDDLKYGIGVCAPEWRKGNALENINPYNILPDPNTPLTKLGKAAYFGWCERSNYYNVLTRELRDQQYFNGKYVRHTVGGSVGYYNLTLDNIVYNDDVHMPTISLKMYVKIIPQDWGLGSSDYPELWFFEVINDSVLVTAQPANIDYFPVIVGSSNFDGYSQIPLSRVGSLLGMQKTLDWLINSHIKAVRIGVNNRFVVDPSLINMKDLYDGVPYIRTRKFHWGRGVANGLQQLNVNDVTARHIADSAYLVEAMQRTAGADETTMGTLRQKGPERLTSAEFQGTQEGLQARLDRIVRVLGTQVIRELGRQFAINTQSYMEEPMWIDLCGGYQAQLKKMFGGVSHLLVSPYDIRADIDVKAFPAYYGDRNVSTLVDLLPLMMQNQELTQRFDIPKIVKFIMSGSGVRNSEDFERIDVQVKPDEEVLEGVANGNLRQTAFV